MTLIFPYTFPIFTHQLPRRTNVVVIGTGCDPPHTASHYISSTATNHSKGKPSMSNLLTKPIPRPWTELMEDKLPVFPTDCFSEPYAELANVVSAALPVSRDYIACSMLGTLSSALVGRVSIHVHGPHYEPIQLYLGMVGESGSRKSAAMNIMSKPLLNWLIAQYDEGDTKLGTAIEQIHTDTTPEALLSEMAKQHGRGIIFSDEGTIANILGGKTYGSNGSSANLDGFLQAYDGGSISVARKTQPSFRLPEAHLSMTLGMQPGMVEAFAANPNLCDRGLPQRMLFFAPEPIGRYNVRLRPEVPPELLDKWAALVQTLAASFRDEKLELTCTQSAYESLADFMQAMVDRETEDLGGSKGMIPWTRKAAGKAARLSGLLTLMKDPLAKTIDMPEMSAAIRLMEAYFIPHAKRIFGGQEQLSEGASSLLRTIRIIIPLGENTFPEAMLRMKVHEQILFKGQRGKQNFTVAMQELAAHGFIRKGPPPAYAGTGRIPLPNWEVHPQLLGLPLTPPESEPEEAGCHITPDKENLS